MDSSLVYANIDAKPCMSSFRWVVLVLDISYLALVRYQKHTNRKYPSERFDDFRSTMIVHVLCGMFIIYAGCFLQLENAFSPWTKVQDEQFFRQLFYYVFALVTVVHSLTVLRVASKVMGERRITMPLYITAGMLNLFNAVYLIFHPTLENAFLVWGSVNTFIFVRLNMVALAVANIDWELSYTYSIISAASITYPMTNQPSFIYYLVIVPILYAPFHEKVCHFYGWDTEDNVGNNQPTEKNISSMRKDLRRVLDLSIVPKKYGSVNQRNIKFEEDDGKEDHESFLPSLNEGDNGSFLLSVNEEDLESFLPSVNEEDLESFLPSVNEEDNGSFFLSVNEEDNAVVLPSVQDRIFSRQSLMYVRSKTYSAVERL